MRIDPTASAYGLFQVVFANVTYELARALYALRVRHDPTFTFEKVPWQFSRMLKELRKELDQLEPDCHEKDSLAEVRRMCRIASNLAPWRDSRIHARVQQVDDGLALSDWKTGERLSITAAECEQRISTAVQVACNLPAHMSYLVREVDSRKAMSDFFENLNEEEIAELRFW
jgi:hypothetical protein